MKLPEIIGIAGTNGAGKDKLADVRFERQHARKVSLSDILRIEATRRGLTTERDNLRIISTEWGKRMGAGALSLMTLEEFRNTRTPQETGLSVVSVRRPAEAEAIQADGGVILWIDADSNMRYERIQAAHRGRPDDLVSYDAFCQDEEIELHPKTDDPFAVNLGGVREIADIEIWNDLPSGEAYEKYLTQKFKL